MTSDEWSYIMKDEYVPKYKYFVVYWNKHEGFLFQAVATKQKAWECESNNGFDRVLELEVPPNA